ncbi:MAG: hypothetical protein KGJ18_11655 [Gammaproteobacteria bacterium]|nr:hypothetical protein [Gammaproteobacteria bacterium]
MMRITHLSFGLILFAAAPAAFAAVSTHAQPASAISRAQPVWIEHILTKYLDNLSPAGGYTQVKFTNTGESAFSAIAFEVVPYAGGEPILQTVKQPVVFGAKGDFKPGESYTVTSDKPVWPGPWKRVDCVHLVGLVLEYADGQTQEIGKAEIGGYLRPQIAAQNCSNPSTPGPHN